MGVPRLLLQLTPYGEAISWRSANVNNEGDRQRSRQVIVDGPSCAYHIYNRCMQNRSPSPTTHVSELPSHMEIAGAAVAFLNDLESFNLNVKWIFFDGHLPVTKRPVRIERLHKYLEQLTTFKSTRSRFSNSRKAVHPSSGAPKLPFDSREPRGSLSSLAASGLLVPVILDALHNSKFADRTRVVSCEADVACATNEHCDADDIVLTNDTDVVVLQPRGSVVFLNDLHFSNAISDNGLYKHEELHAIMYEPQKIAKRLNCKDLIGPAFYLKQDPSRSLKECGILAAEHSSNSNNNIQYMSFRAQYETATVDLPNKTQLRNVCERLDPRVSEVVHEFLASRPKPHAHPTDSAAESSTKSMFLPFLLDDPTRASPWQPSVDIRRIAYSVLSLASGGNPKRGQSIIQEYDRRGDRILPISISLHSDTASLINASNGLTASITQLQLRTSIVPIAERWRIIVIMLTLSAILESGRVVPLPTNVKRVFTVSEKPMLWEHVYISAQCEALLYSLRILVQILKVWFALLPEGIESNKDWALGVEIESFSDLNTSLRELYACLKEMPVLHDILISPGGRLPVEVAKEHLEALLKEFFGEPPEAEKQPPTDEQDVDGSAKTRKKKKRKVENVSKDIETSKPRMSANMFDLLDEEA